MHIFSFLLFCDFVKKTTPLHYLSLFVFLRFVSQLLYQKKIKTHKSPQNDRLNLIFMKGKKYSWEKNPRNGLKMAIHHLLFFCKLAKSVKWKHLHFWP